MVIIHEENIVFISVIFMDIFISAYPWGPLLSDLPQILAPSAVYLHRKFYPHAKRFVHDGARAFGQDRTFTGVAILAKV
jgi:hypothetical protein